MKKHIKSQLIAGMAAVVLVWSVPALAGSGCSWSSDKSAKADKGWKAASAAAEMVYEKDIVETAMAAGNFNTLVAAVKAAGLVETLQGEGPFTVFAPTDEAFAALPEGTVESLLLPENREKLQAVLTYHVVPGSLEAKSVLKQDFLGTVQGQSLVITTNNKGQAFVDGAQIAATDIMTSNGVIHVIDSVILPAEENIVTLASTAGDFNTLVSAVKAAGLVDVLKDEGPYTVFAPTDAAFAALPEGKVEKLLKPENKEKLQKVLTYHVVPGKLVASNVVEQPFVATVQGQTVSITTNEKGAMIDGVNIVKTDIIGSNGVIHVIDGVIMPAWKSIPEVATEAGSFNTLLKAVEAAGLAETLSGEGPYTVFAPTDEAFAQLPAETLNSLLQPENVDKLREILLYHVVPGEYVAANVLKNESLKSAMGAPIAFSMKDEKAMAAGAGITATDIHATNGVIHVIDAVILPPEQQAKAGSGEGHWN